MLIRLLNAIANLVFPATCVLCNARTAWEKDICRACVADLPQLENPCPQCALPLSASAGDPALQCGRCLRYAPCYDKTLALYRYQEPIIRLITQLKFKHQLKYARLLGELLSDRLLEHQRQGYVLPEVIIPVPLHLSRLRERGFNQSLEIARIVAKCLHIPIDALSCQRQRATLTQSELLANQRKNNIRNAFTVLRPLAAKHVGIIDDVVTTGYTVDELSKQLRKAGVQTIDIWCCARTIR